MLVAEKTRLIVNPRAGRDAGPGLIEPLNAKLRSALGDMDIVLTVGPGDAARAASEAALSGHDLVLVAGGDGTLNEALNGLCEVPGGLERVTIGVVPLGTGNDFAAALGLPEELPAALDALLEGRVVSVDVGSLNGRRFVNVSAGGFVAEVSEAVDPQLKTVAGKLAYLIGGAQVLLDFEPVGFRARGEGEAGPITLDGKAQLFAVCNGRRAGGGHVIAPLALFDDGWLDVCLVDAMPTLEMVGLLTHVSRGEHVDDPRVRYFRARSLELELERETHVNTDGEVLVASRCTYAIEPLAARFLAGAPQPSAESLSPSRLANR